MKQNLSSSMRVYLLLFTVTSALIAIADPRTFARTQPTVKRVFVIKYVQPSDAIELLRKQLPLRVTLHADDAHDIIIAKGSARAIKSFVKLLGNVDTKDGPLSHDVQITYPVKHGSAQALMTIIKGTNDKILILPDAMDNKLVVTGSLAQQLRISRLLRDLDKPEQVTTSVTYALMNAVPAPAPTDGQLGTSSSEKLVQAVDESLTKRYSNLSLALDPNTNVVAISGDARGVAAAQNMLRRLDLTPVQIELDAAVYELTRNEIRNVGFNLPANEINTTISEFFTPAPTNEPMQVPIFAAPGKVIRAPLSVVAQLNTLVSHGSGSAVAYPQIRTISGRTAELHVGQTIPFSNFQFISGSSNVSTVGQIGNSLETGIILKITPVAAYVTDADKRPITLFLDANLSNFVAFTPQGAPEVTTRRTVTTVQISPGEIIVISGMRGQTTSEAIGVPRIFEHIPVLDQVFKNRSYNREDTQVFVVIEPRVIKPLNHFGEVPVEDLDKVFHQDLPSTIHSPAPLDTGAFGSAQSPLPSPSGMR